MTSRSTFHCHWRFCGGHDAQRRPTNVVTPYYFQRDLEQKRIKVVPRIKQYGLILIMDTKSTHPYGYERIGVEVELLLDL